MEMIFQLTWNFLKLSGNSVPEVMQPKMMQALPNYAKNASGIGEMNEYFMVIYQNIQIVIAGDDDHEK